MTTATLMRTNLPDREWHDPSGAVAHAADSRAVCALRSAVQRGFTLIEILISCAVIGILASITVPTYVSRRMAANEAAVIATLRAVSQAQFQFRAQNSLDTNGDGASEFASFGELSGRDNLRGQTVPLTQRLLNARFGEVDSYGHAVAHGYRVAIYLPDSGGIGLPATLANLPNVDPVRGRDFFTCLAWPLSTEVTGQHAFFVNQQGQVLRTVLAPYSGLERVPPAGAGLQGTASAAVIDSQTLAMSGAGADGNNWVPVY